MRGFDFDEALVALQNELHCFAYKLTADKDEAEDLLQETMLKALDNKDKFNPGTNFKSWMYTIMRNAFINNCRAKKIRGNLYVLSEPESHFLLRDGSFIFVDNGHDAKEIREALNILCCFYVVCLRGQISGNSRKDRSATGYDKKPYLL